MRQTMVFPNVANGSFLLGFVPNLNIGWSFPRPTHCEKALLWDQCRTDRYWQRHRISRGERGIGHRALAQAHALSERPDRQAWRTVRDAIHDLPDPDSCQLVGIQNHRFQPGARAYTGHTGSPLDEPAKTLKAGVHGVPGGENMLVYPDGRVRYFSVRESARLQTFPDSYRLHGSWSEAMRQLGNAVPVELAAVIAKDVMKHLRAA